MNCFRMLVVVVFLCVLQGCGSGGGQRCASQLAVQIEGPTIIGVGQTVTLSALGGDSAGSFRWSASAGAALSLEMSSDGASVDARAMAPSPAFEDEEITLIYTLAGASNEEQGGSCAAITHKMTAIEVRLTQIDFQGQNNVNIRIDAVQDIGDPTTGNASSDIEWIADLRDNANSDRAWDSQQSAPAAFVMDTPLEALVEFEVVPPGISHFGLTADSGGVYGPISETQVSVGDVRTSHSIRSSDAPRSVQANDVTLRWNVDAVTLNGVQHTLEYPIAQTTHRIYTLHAKPIEPMTEPWAVVLELAAGLARGEGSSQEQQQQVADEYLIMERLTNGLHHSCWTNTDDQCIEANKDFRFLRPVAKLVYETDRVRADLKNAPSTEDQRYDLADFLGFLDAPENVQQCNDNSLLLSYVLARSLGIEAGAVRFWRVENSGEPQNEDELLRATYVPAGGTEVISRSFNYHQVSTLDGRIYDPSIRPVDQRGPYIKANLEAYVEKAFPVQDIQHIEVQTVCITPVEYSRVLFSSLSPCTVAVGQVTEMSLFGEGLDSSVRVFVTDMYSAEPVTERFKIDQS